MSGAGRRLRVGAACALALWLAACAVPPGPAPVEAPAPRGAPPVAAPVPAPMPAQPPPPEAAAAPAPAPGAPGPDEGVLLGQGLASWYGPGLHGRPTANGERFDRYGFTAAHRTLPFGTWVCVRSRVNGRTVVVRINDRGPFAGGRVIDLSEAAARELGMVGLGIKPVELWQADEGDTGCAPAGGDAAAPARVAQPAKAPRRRGR